MQVYAEWVWRVEFDQSKGVLRARLLAETKLSGLKLLSDVGSGTIVFHYPPLPIDDVVGILREIGRVFLQLRDDFRALNLQGYIPVWSENHGSHFARKHGGLMFIRLAYDDLHRERPAVVLVVCAQAKFRDVHHHRRMGKFVRYPAPALQGQL